MKLRATSAPKGVLSKKYARGTFELKKCAIVFQNPRPERVIKTPPPPQFPMGTQLPNEKGEENMNSKIPRNSKEDKIYIYIYR